MYKIIIADDVKPVCDGIKILIENQFPQLDIIGAYTDGYTALDAVKKHIPDILISDIRMPDVDGLELCKAMRSISDKSQIILISAYTEFHYAKKAIELRALGYLVKPYDIDQLQQYIIKAIQNLDILKNQESFINSYKNISALKCEYYLSAFENIYAGKSDAKEIGHFMMLNDSTTASQCFVSEISLCSPDCNDIYGIFENSDSDKLTSFLLKNNVIVLFFNEISAFKQYIDHYTALLKAKNLPVDFNFSPVMTFGEWGEHCSIRKKAKLLSDAFKSLDITTFLNKNQKEIEKTKTPEQLLKLTSEFLNISSLYNYDYKTNLSTKENIIGFFNLYLSQSNDLSTEIKAYINQHFDDINLSITQISNHFKTSTSYICEYFKKQNTFTINEYISKVRIDKAKELLIEDNKATVEKISLAVGYCSRTYFQRLFKKQTHMTPQQYRKKMKIS